MAVVMAGETEDAVTWLDYSLKALTTTYPHWAGYEGGWAEGIGYGRPYNEFYIPAFDALRMTADFDLWKRPFFSNVRHFFIYCTAHRGEIRPFGDGAEKGGPGAPGGGGYANLLWYHAHRFNDPYTAWWVKQVKDWDGSFGELSLLYEDNMESKPPTALPGSRAFRGVGWAGLHSDMSKLEDDTVLLFKSSPYGSVSHSHADQNSFSIMKGGHALAIPSGYYGPTYGMPHHAEWTRSTKANNCVLVNGEGQVIRSAKANGQITAFEDQPGLTYVAGDATPAYMGKLKRFHRHILFLRPGLFLLLDDLEAPEPALFQWMLHSFEEMELNGHQKVVSTRGDAILEVHLRSSVGMALSQTNKFDTPYNTGIPEDFHKDLPDQWHVTGETGIKAKSARIGAIMAVYRGNESPKIQILGQNGWFGARVSGQNGAFGTVEGWIQLESDAPAPKNIGKALICGIASDGQKFSV